MSEETLKQHVAAMERGARCAICPLYGCGQGPVMPEVRFGALLTIIGEAPHTTEVEEGRTFAGATSEVLTATLPEVGVARQDCTYTNAILCRPPGGHMLDFAAELNKKHKKAVAKARAERVEPPPLITPQECCAPRLERDIADSESRVLLALGSEGLKAAAHAMKLPYAGQKAAPGTARVTSIKKQHGSPVLAPDGRVLVSSLHPVFAGYGNNAKFMPVIREDLKRAGRIAKRGAVIDWYEPEFIIKPSHDTCINVMERMLRARALVTVDIETDGKDPNTCGIRCVGLGAVIDGQEVVIVIPLRHMDGRRWWSPADEQRIENALRELLEANPLAGQNLLFDTCVLLRLKLLITRGKRWFDCYLDDETEFLTNRGWRKYDDVRAEDQLATIAPDNTLEWQRYETRVDKQRQGHLLQLETQHTRAVVTPKHTVWHQKTKRDGTRLASWQLTPAEQLLIEPGGDANILRACRPAQGRTEETVTLDGVTLDAARLKLLGLAVGDGTLRFHEGQPYRLRISQKVDGRAYTFLQKFTAWATSERQHEKREAWRKTACTESMWEVVGSFAAPVARAFHAWFGRYSVERRLPAWAFTLPLELRRALLDGLLLGDASEVRGATLFRSCSRQLADDVHALAVTLGIVSTMHKSGKCWVVSLHPAASNEVQVVTRETTKSVNGFASRRPDASYRVVCFVVPNHTLVTRSGGRPAFHGNTMLAHHNTSQSELPHDLGFIAARNFEAPRWKEDADAKSIDGVDDYWLHLYCCKDVLGEMRLVDPLARQVNEEGTALALKTDTILAPTARDMGVLGLNIDEDRRRKFFDILDAKVSDQATKLKLVTGNPDFNPNAFKQVADFLYIKKGLSPPYATDGREWEELEDDEELEIDTDDPEVILAKAATNELALLRLLELGVDEQTRQFIEGELFYRGLQKCKSTYVGLKAEDENGARVIVDTHRKKGYLQTEFWLGKRHSILHPSWKLHITPTGRWATSPNCFDGETEVMTRRGWVKFSECRPESDEVLEADPETGAMRFVWPSQWIRKPHDGHLLHFKSQQLDIMCTEDHRLPLRRRDGSWHDVLARDWVGDRQLRQAGQFIGGHRAVSSAFITLLCAAQADGTFDLRANCIDFSLQKQRKVKRLLHALRDLGVNPTVTRQSKQGLTGMRTVARIYVPSCDVVREVRALLGAQKQWGSWLLDLNRAALDAFAEEVWHWDGHLARRSMYSSSVEANADWVQALVVMSGRRSKRRRYFPAQARLQKRPNWQLDTSDTEFSWTTNVQPACVPYVGDVWCVTVPSSYILTRREGKVAVVGQCQNWPERIVFDIELYKATERIRAAEMAEFGKPKTPEAGILNTRAMVVAPDEHILVGADYAAIELRLYAAMSGDALLLDAILHGKDPHALNYATMQSRHPGDLMKWYDRVMTSSPTVKKYLRIIAKRFGFLVIYGGQKDKLYRTMASDRNPDGTRSFPDLKPADVEMWFDNWHRMHPETKRWHEAVVRAWSRHGFVATILDGRRRFFLGGMDMTAMPNMTIQGSAASIANRAMIRVAEQCPHRGWSDLSGPVLQVHDFIGLQVPLKRQKEAEQLLMREMPYEYNGMKYEVEQKSGLSWDKT